jgi:inner membrane protein
MPSPVGHVIAGLTAGWFVAGSPFVAPKVGQKVAGTFPGKVPATFWEAAVFGALGALPDIDLIFGAHSGPTHSLGAAIVVGILAAIWAGVAQRLRSRRPEPLGLRPLTLAIACFAAYASHVLLDWLARDTTAPIGIMALWPFSRAPYESDLHIFMAISRRYYQGWTFVRQNAIALVSELLILVPLLVLVMKVRRRRGDIAAPATPRAASRTPLR